jgi:hypothetical protein
MRAELAMSYCKYMELREEAGSFLPRYNENMMSMIGVVGPKLPVLDTDPKFSADFSDLGRILHFLKCSRFRL